MKKIKVFMPVSNSKYVHRFYDKEIFFFPILEHINDICRHTLYPCVDLLNT